MPWIGSEETSLIVDQKGRLGCGPRILPGSQVIHGSYPTQESILKFFGWKGGSSQVTPKDIQLEIETHNGRLWTLIVQTFNVGQFLGTGHQTNIKICSIQWFDASFTAGITTAKEIQKSLFGLSGNIIVKAKVEISPRKNRHNFDSVQRNYLHGGRPHKIPVHYLEPTLMIRSSDSSLRRKELMETPDSTSTVGAM